MCGIAGIVKLDPREHAEADRLARMRIALRHRGPDGEGTYLDGPAGLTHTRLAIVDVSAGQQPMCNEDQSVWVVFNGEIYNHAILRTTLESEGHAYRTRCDTESLLHLYEQHGDDSVEQLAGMFAFAIWDRARRRLLLARDRLGIKPLYYTTSATELCFASEIKALFAAGAVRPTVNEPVLPEFLATRFVSGAETFFTGVHKLLPGHVASWSLADGLRTRRYWAVPAPVDAQPATVKAHAPIVRHQLEAAVRRHLMSDVPLGVFLSGGLDSSALAAMVARQTRTPINTFAVGFAEKDANELPYARMVAEHIGATHREVTVTPGQYFEALPQLIWHEDEPIAFPSSVPLYFVANLARESVKVVLTGEGADELFLGYNRYRATLWNSVAGRPYWAVVPRRARQALGRVLETMPQPIRRYGRRTFLALEPGIRNLFFNNFAVFSEERQRSLYRSPDRFSQRDPYGSSLDCYDGTQGGLLDRMSQTDLQTYLHELLMKQDQMSMAASIESRVPFLDNDVVSYVSALPGHVKLRGTETKAVLRAAVADLVPPAILERRKMGFPVPVGAWLRNGFSPLVDEFVLSPRAQQRDLFDPDSLRTLVAEHRAGTESHGDRLWLLINLEIWQRMTCDGESPSDVVDAITPSLH